MKYTLIIINELQENEQQMWLYEVSNPPMTASEITTQYKKILRGVAKDLLLEEPIQVVYATNDIYYTNYPTIKLILTPA